MGKRKKSFYAGAAKKYKGAQLQAGCVGFMCSFVRGKDKVAKSELFELLKSYAVVGNDLASTTLQSNSDDDEDSDMESALQAEIHKLKEERKVEPFKVLDSGVNHILFMQTRLQDHSDILYKLLEDAKEGNLKTKTKYLLRILPVLTSCRASEEKIKIALHQAIEIFMKSSHCPKDITYKTEVKVRNNTDAGLTSKSLIQLTGETLREQNIEWKANLKDPSVCILLDVLKTVCCVSVVHSYNQYKKFNLQELSISRVKDRDTTSCVTAPDTDGKDADSSAENKTLVEIGDKDDEDQ